MRPLFVALVWLVVAAHLAFLVYLPVGGFLALRRRRAITAHVAAVSWAFCSVAFGLWCPLTALERWARARAGMPPLAPGGFIDHYLTGRIYPDAATGLVQGLALLAVLVSWAVYRATARPGSAADATKQIS